MTIAVRRGCGTRTKGGVYLTTQFSDFGTPIDQFLYDPPWVPTTPEGEVWVPNALGMALVERPDNSGVFDIWDHIGAKFYPYFPDYWEEGKRFEYSRKAPPLLDWDKLKMGLSQTIGVHPKGLIECDQETLNDIYLSRSIFAAMNGCPLDNALHISGCKDMCVSLLWQLIGNAAKDAREYDRAMPTNLKKGEDPTFIYHAVAPNPTWDCTWTTAAVFHLPIHKIEIVNDPEQGLHEDRLEIIRNSSCDIPVEVVEE